MTTDSQSLPPLPEPHVLNGHYRDHVDSVNGFSLSQLEEYGDARAAHARKQALEEAAKIARETCDPKSTDFGDGFNHAAVFIEIAIKELK